MRHAKSAAVAAVLLMAAQLAAPASAPAAPTCDTRNGETVKCGTPRAMPVGWAPSPADAFDRPPPAPDLSPAEGVALIYILGAFFALIALMPEFDGRRDSDWDKQEGDTPKRR